MKVTDKFLRIILTQGQAITLTFPQEDAEAMARELLLARKVIEAALRIPCVNFSPYTDDSAAYAELELALEAYDSLEGKS